MDRGCLLSSRRPGSERGQETTPRPWAPGRRRRVVEAWFVPAPTHFDRLGLPRRYAIDPAELERNYLARSRELHPDFHQQAAGAQQRASMELTAALNDAYAVLKHSFRRAEYLLMLEGAPTAAEHKEMAPA